MKWWLILMMVLSVCGCAVKKEVKSASLKPYQFKYEKPVVEETPIWLEQVSYAQKKLDFSSVFQLNYESVGVALSQDGKSQTMEVWDWIDHLKPIEMTTYAVPFYNGQTYRLNIVVSSDIADTLTIVFDDYTNALIKKSYRLGPEMQSIVLDYTHSGWNVDDGMIKLIFSTSQEGSYGSIAIQEMSFQRTSGQDVHVKVNQLGYLPESQKLAIFNSNAGDWFDVIDVETNQAVYTGQIIGRTENVDAKEVNSYGDFSEVKEPGTYRIVSQMNGKSYDFVVAENLYDDLLNDVLKMITLQRCGVDLSEDMAGSLSHEACHCQLAKSYASWGELDVSGGWHDAGDYGRYTLTAVKTINDLLLSYLVYPDSFSDEMGISESGNGIADVLDEAKVGLDWLKKMQIDWGPVYTAAVTTQFADFVMPENDYQDIWVLQEENTSTAAAAGALAMGSLLFQEIDPLLSETYLDSAVKAYDYAVLLKGETDRRNPEDISAGDYANASDADELYFSACMLYAVTHDEKYLSEIQQALSSSIHLFGMSYYDFGGYGTYVLLKDEQFRKNKMYGELYQKWTTYIQSLVWDNVNDGYHLSIDSYHWGANMDVTNNAMLLLLANDICPSNDLVDAAFEQLSYLLGKNSLNLSFVTGTGTVSPQNIHHRISEVQNTLMKGALVGGPDGSLESSLPVAKRYWDTKDSYTTNEVAIYYNSPLVFVVAAFQ